MKLRGIATEPIPSGAGVLVRDFKVSLAPPEIANGTAREYRFGKKWPRGEYVDVDPVEGLGDRSLQAMADGPIMEPLRLYLPAGKITEDEWQQRTFDQFTAAGIDPNEPV